MAKKAAVQVGLFPLCYDIGGGKPGAPLFRVSLSVYTPGKSVNGVGHITQTTSPPLDIGTNLHGEFTYMCVMPKSCHILVTATGYPIVSWPKGGGVGPVLQPNADLRMVVTDDWESGTATFRYLDAKGNWQEVGDAPVRMVPCNNKTEK
jgi:hypothetical protein